MIYRHAILCFTFYICVVKSKFVQITLRENFTMPCPNSDMDLVDKQSMKFSFDFLSGPSDGDQVNVVDQHGKQRTIYFPGCYKVNMAFRLKQKLENPYIEAFLQLGQNIACKPHGKQLHGAVDVCTNITQTNWCPQSHNGQLRGMLEGKTTCQFCNLCDQVKNPDVQKYVKGAQEMEKCSSDGDMQRFQFTLCTPSRREMRQKESDEKLEEYWNYLKQGVLTAVVHVMDRKSMSTTKLSQCKRMCQTYKSKRGVNKTYRSTLLRSIETICSPLDEYAACVYHTQKFDIKSDF